MRIEPKLAVGLAYAVCYRLIPALCKTVMTKTLYVYRNVANLIAGTTAKLGDIYNADKPPKTRFTASGMDYFETEQDRRIFKTLKSYNNFKDEDRTVLNIICLNVVFTTVIVS